MQSFVNLPSGPSLEWRYIIALFALSDAPRLQKLKLVECYLLRKNPVGWGVATIITLQYRLTSNLIYVLALL